MNCKNCIYFIDEYGKHLKGCYLYPYKLTLPNNLACDRFLEGIYGDTVFRTGAEEIKERGDD